MWTIIKFEKKNLNILKLELEKKLGFKCQFYIPKLLLKRYQKNKLIKKEFNLLGEYLFALMKNFVTQILQKI